MIDRIMSQLSEQDKLAQLQGIRPNDLMENGKLSLEKCRKLIPHGIGHLCQFSSSLHMTPEEIRDFVRELQHYLMTQTPSGLPAIFHEEALTGFPSLGATTFPQHLNIACTWNPELAEQKTRFTAETMRKAGSTQGLSPMVDICRNAHWPRMEESLGEDPCLTASLGVAFVKGLQGNDLRSGVAGTSKHFAGYGGENTDRREFLEEIVMPHEALIRVANVAAVMPGYHQYNDIPCSCNSNLLTDILRDQLGFDGAVVSDYGAVSLSTKRGYASDLKDAGARSINAGMDIELCQGECFPFLSEALQEGAVSQTTLDRAVRNALALKEKLGLLNKNPQIGVDGPLDFDPPAHRSLAYEAAAQSAVLLKNNGILPLRGGQKILLTGPNADSFQALLGDYTYQSLSGFWWNIPTDPERPKLITLREGLAAKLGGGARLAYERGCNWSEVDEVKINTTDHADSRLEKVKMMVFKDLAPADPANAVRIASESDVVIAAMGENIYLCGEGRERNGIRLPGRQEEFVQKLIETGKPVVLVIFGGRPQVVDKLVAGCAAIVQAWFPGEEGGNAVADLLLGNANFSGKLCVSYPETDENKAISYNCGYTDGNMPLYPFGYGLSYTTFEYSCLQLPERAVTTDEWIPVSFRVKNSGARSGAEIAQLYVSPKGLPVPCKPLQLKGFERLELAPGEEKTVRLKISPHQLACWVDNAWTIFPGSYEIHASASSTDVRLRGTVELTGEKRVIPHREVFFAARG